MEEQLKKLKLHRRMLKGTVTRIENFVSDPISYAGASLEMLQARKDKLVSTFEDYERTQLDILALEPTDTETIEALEEKYFTLISKINASLKDLDQKQVSQCQSVASSKLPNIDIPIFDGKDFTKYKPFIDLFVAVFHNNKSLSDVQKLFYLRKYLVDEALSVIINLPLVNQSYSEALELLQKRYDNKSRLIINHVNVLLDIPQMQKGNAASLRIFISEVQQQIYALKNLEQPIDKWDMLLIGILLKKLDQYTNRAFQLDKNPDSLPTLDEFLSFLERRAMALEDSGDRSTYESNKRQINKASHVATNSSKKSNIDVNVNKHCRFCGVQGHLLYECPKFKLSPEKDRNNFIHSRNLCTTCLNEHQGKCKFNFKCKICRLGHNTLAHLSEKSDSKPVALHSSNNGSSSSEVLLPTIKVKLNDVRGRAIYVRALLDSGSQASFITNSLMEELSLTPICQQTNIIGIGNKTNKINQLVNVDIYSPVRDVHLNVKCHVVQSITTPLPQQCINISKLSMPKGILLSDELFYLPCEISLLLGADVYYNICLSESIKLVNGPMLQNTLFGYVVGGMVSNSLHSDSNNFVTNLAICDPQKLEDVMHQFWLAEKAPEISTKDLKQSHEFFMAEKSFRDSVKFDNKQFSVDMPLVSNLDSLDLGDSFSAALQRFLTLERKFQHNTLYLEKYKNFIEEYISLGHARLVDIGEYDISSGGVYFLPHHAVLNEESLTTKLRVVFDGSMKSKSGRSLNDVLYNGPVVQSDLFDILLLWRTFIYTLICDIQKMFRCVNINPHHTPLQNILWRDDPNKPIQCLQLQTVTYGLKSSTFLATRCLLELSSQYKHEFPLAAQALSLSTYVDDVISGSDNIDELYCLKGELINLLLKGGFNLHKWCSNFPQAIDDLPNDKKYFEKLDINSNNIIKTLGVRCDILNDTFSYSMPMINDDDIHTKREVLSFIGKMFDPLGLIGPVVVIAKVFMQTLWSTKIDWDTILPQDLLTTWKIFLNNLKLMGILTIPRCVNSVSKIIVELVGYADASIKALGCCLYLRVINSDGTILVNLLCSRSRVAPLNKSITIPKLELNSALLLSQTAHRVHTILLKRFPLKVYLYSDSQIALSWIKSTNIKSNPYVINRVNQIKELTNQYSWAHVSTDNNPADLLSRGCEPQKLKNCYMWWHGPKELSSSDFQHPVGETFLPIQSPVESQVANVCNTTDSVFVNDEKSILNLINKTSDLDKLQRIVAYILRFSQNCRKNNLKYTGPLTPYELNKALSIIIKIIQKEDFSKEIQSIKNDLPIKSGLSSLHPFLDNEGMLRVGGRLQNATDISYNKKHPIILPKSCHFTNILIHKEHLRLLHAGAKLILGSLSQKYWIISATREIKKIVNKCIKCFRMKAAAAVQLMGSLPQDRLTATTPFHVVGVDFCGPFNMKVFRLRKPLVTKGYVALYVCFATKAIHMELVSDLTTEAFLACLKRFIARRGMPLKIYCDNAKTFKGAANELHRLFSSNEYLTFVKEYCLDRRIEFNFIPSYSPEFGGLWEAGVKSFKFHFKRIVGDNALTYEALNTVVIEIEGILNSRPLLPISSDISSCEYLTPGHFLVGKPIMNYPEQNVSEICINRLRFWSVLSKIKQDFWKVWSRDYLTQLQSRPKWRQHHPNIKEGDLVIVRTDNTPPFTWPMARVVKTLPGPDGKVRVAEIKLSNNKVYTRSLRKLCPLPMC